MPKKKQITIESLIKKIKTQVQEQNLQPKIDQIAKSVVKKARTNDQLWQDYLKTKSGGAAKKRILKEYQKRQAVGHFVDTSTYLDKKALQQAKTAAEPLGDYLQQIRDQYTQHIGEQGTGSTEYTWLYGPNENNQESSDPVLRSKGRLSWVAGWGFAHFGDKMGIVVKFRNADNSDGFCCIYLNTTLDEYRDFSIRSPKGKAVWAQLYYRDYTHIGWHD